MSVSVLTFLSPRTLLVLPFLIIGLVSPAFADFDDALTAYDNGDYQTALNEFMELATAGDSNAQAYLALMYLEGQAVEADIGQALRWYVESAEQGHVDSQYALALIAADGMGGIEQNPEVSLMWLNEAARRGHRFAQFDMGMMFSNGIGVERDTSEGRRWFEMAAEQGHIDAQYNLGVIYMTPIGVQRDADLALEWFERAAEQGHPNAQYNLGLAYLSGQVLEPNPQEAQRWLTLAAEQNNPSADVALGLIAHDALLGGEPDYLAAVEHFRRAAMAGSAEGRYFLGVSYWRGEGLEQDPVEALAWVELAAAVAEPGSDIAQRVSAVRNTFSQVMSAQEISEASALARARAIDLAGSQGG